MKEIKEARKNEKKKFQTFTIKADQISCFADYIKIMRSAP